MDLNFFIDNCKFLYLILPFLLNGFSCQSNNSNLTYKVSLSDSKIFVRSYHSLSTLAVYEKTIYAVLKDFFDCALLEESLENQFLSYFDEYVECSYPTYASAEDFQFGNVVAGHPFLSSRMIYRYVEYLKPIIKSLAENVSETYEILNSISEKINVSIGWPTQMDVNDSWESLLRLHHVHDFNISELVSGNVFATDIKFGLNAKHCLEIGKFAVNERFFALAIDWLETAKRLIEEKNDQTIEDSNEVDANLMNAFVIHDIEWDLASKMDPMFFTEKLIKMPHAHERVKRRTYLNNIFKGQRDPQFNHINFWSLCSGDILWTEEEKIELFCWYDKKSNLAWVINPLKIERLAWSPDVVQIYDVLSNSLISKLISAAEPRLIRSKVHTPKGEHPYSKHRTSATAWLDEGDFPELMSVPRIIELVTGLVVVPKRSAEMMQLATYTFGHRYEVHTDSLEDQKDEYTVKNGDRIATFMIYLSDVQKGGYTAFPQAGIAARPIKGSAVFWYNLKRNGQPDLNSSHGGCPVILGNKWIANKWIRYNNQFSARTCGLDPHE